MIRRSFRIGLTLGLLAGIAFALSKMLGSRADRSEAPRPAPVPRPTPAAPPMPVADAALAPAAPSAPTASIPKPAATAKPPAKAPAKRPAAPPAAKKGPGKTGPAKKAPAKKKPLAAAWIAPKGDVCPTSHPVKAKLSSKIFHLPGMLNYDRTKPDRCYKDAGAAEGDGLRPAKR